MAEQSVVHLAAFRCSMLGTLLTKWTIRLALVCYVTYLGGWLTVNTPRWERMARTIWTLGCMLFIVHVALAFHYYHQWSHTVAWQHTAERTRQLLGVAVGDGIYFSYVFLVMWVIDVGYLWVRPLWNEVANGTPAWAASATATCVPHSANRIAETPFWRVLVHVFLLFVAINGAIVFEAGPTRWAGIAACLALGFLAVRRVIGWFSSHETKCPSNAAGTGSSLPVEPAVR